MTAPMAILPRKTEFWWASIHGADPEPVEKTECDGRPCVYTCGCADPFYLDEPGIRFVLDAMKRPKHPDIIAAEQAEHEARIAANWRRGHGWRGPR